MGKENSREKAQKAHKSNVFCAAGAFSQLFHCIPSRRLARLWTLELEGHQKNVQTTARFILDQVVAPVPHRHYVLAIPRMLRPYFQRHRHLLKRLCTLAHESLTEYLRTALGCPEGVPGIIMTLHTFGEYSILLNSAVDTREQVR